MSEKRIAYKVVKQIDGTWRSHQVPAKSRFSLVYAKGRVTEAPKGTHGIACFRTLEDAREWDRHGTILKVQTIGRKIREKTNLLTWSDELEDCQSPEDIRRFSSTHNLLLGRWIIPAGTVFYPAVIPLEVVNA